MDKKKNGSILIIIGMIVFIVSFLSFLNHVSPISLPQSNAGHVNIPDWNGIIAVGNNKSEEYTGFISDHDFPKENETIIPILETLCAILNLISACFSGYIAYIGYKMRSEDSHEKAKPQEQKSRKNYKNSRNRI